MLEKHWDLGSLLWGRAAANPDPEPRLERGKGEWVPMDGGRWGVSTLSLGSLS